MQTYKSRRMGAALLTGVLALGAPTLPTLAQTTTHKITPKKRKNFAQRHPNLTSAAVGVVAYKAAKKTGKNRAAKGGKRNFAQRHPLLTGVGAAVVTHKAIKRSEKK